MKIMYKVKIKMFKVLALATVLNSVSQALTSDISNEIEYCGAPSGDGKCKLADQQPKRGYEAPR